MGFYVGGPIASHFDASCVRIDLVWFLRYHFLPSLFTTKPPIALITPPIKPAEFWFSAPIKVSCTLLKFNGGCISGGEVLDLYLSEVLQPRSSDQQVMNLGAAY
jgi:hypothetical protein